MHTGDSKCAEQFGVKSAPGIALVRSFDDSPIVYSGEAKKSSIVDFAQKGSVPILITFSEDFIEPIFAE